MNNFSQSRFLICLCFILFSDNLFANYYSGFATRDQNPILMSYWIPHTVAPLADQQSVLSSALFITNTLHDENKSNEALFIDGEIYRLDINFQYQNKRWLFFTQMPLISSDGGFIDQIIFDWHEFFGFEQGGRQLQANDQIHYLYSRNGQTIFDQRSAFEGIGDISIGGTYSLEASSQGIWSIGFGVNIPTGNSNLFINSRSLESAFWTSYTSLTSLQLPYFFSAGIINTSQNGLLSTHVSNHVLFMQSGFENQLNENYALLFQLDYHSSFLQDTNTTALGQSLQVQIGLKIKTIGENKDLSLFFSEDLLYQSAPDITFSTQFNWRYE